MSRPRVPEVALAVIAIASGALLWALIDFTRTGYSYTGEPSQEEMLAVALNHLSWMLAPVLAFATAACALGLLFVWCFAAPAQSTSATRTTSAAGSTENLTATTSPNSSPSISNSCGSPSMTTSTDRPLA
jgi:hypothetical protein